MLALEVTMSAKRGRLMPVPSAVPSPLDDRPSSIAKNIDWLSATTVQLLSRYHINMTPSSSIRVCCAGRSFSPHKKVLFIKRLKHKKYAKCSPTVAEKHRTAAASACRHKQQRQRQQQVALPMHTQLFNPWASAYRRSERLLLCHALQYGTWLGHIPE